jgi:hypothetical protein
MAQVRSVIGSRRRAFSFDALDERLARVVSDALHVAEPATVARMLHAHAERLEARALEVLAS